MKYIMLIFIALQGCGTTYPPISNPPVNTTTATPITPLTCPEVTEALECKCHEYKKHKCIHIQCEYKDTD